MTVRKLLAGVVGISVLLGAGPLAASAQEMTERYIPVGQSPGLSAKYTVIGTIQTVNPRERTVVITGPAGTWTAKITDRTKIWLDRSKLRLTNLKGTIADLRQGRTVEVKHESHERGVFSGPADWIKVQIVAAR
jgi:hypothetical protein